MKNILVFVALMVPAVSSAQVSRCSQETVSITRVWTGGFFGINRDLYGPVGARSGQCTEIYNRYFDSFGDSDCERMADEYIRQNGFASACAQLGYVIDPWDGKTDANVCYVCNL